VIAIVVGMVGSLFASDAWNDFTCAAGETANPRIILQLNLFFNTLLVNLLYIIFNPPYLLVLPFQQNPNGSTFSSMRTQFAMEDRVDNLAACMFLGEEKKLFT